MVNKASSIAYEKASRARWQGLDSRIFSGLVFCVFTLGNGRELRSWKQEEGNRGWEGNLVLTTSKGGSVVFWGIKK